MFAGKRNKIFDRIFYKIYQLFEFFPKFQKFYFEYFYKKDTIKIFNLYYKSNNHELNYNKKLYNKYYPQIYPTLYNFSNLIKTINSKNICVINFGSCSGRDLEYLKNNNSEIQYISVDINDIFLKLQKEKYNFHDVEYIKSDCLNLSKICKDKLRKYDYIILFTIGTMHYLNYFEINSFFNNIKKLNNIYLCFNVSINTNLQNIKHSIYKKNFKYLHPYKHLAKKHHLKFFSYKVIDLNKKNLNNFAHLDCILKT